MDLRHLRYFVAVAETLNFTRAAQRLHIGQPPLSQQIRALETELGCTLFARTQRRVALTAAGEQMLGMAKKMLDDAEHLITQTQRAARGELGTLRLGYMPSLPFNDAFPDVLRSFRTAYPEVQLVMRAMMTEEQIDCLIAGDLDIGLIRTEYVDIPEPLSLTPLFEDQLHIAVYEGHRFYDSTDLSIEDLRGERFIGYSEGSGTGIWRQFSQLCGAQGYVAQVEQAVGESTTLLGWVKQGLGLGVVPQALTRLRAPGLRYVRLREIGARSHTSVAYVSGSLGAVGELLLKEVRQWQSREGAGLIE